MMLRRGAVAALTWLPLAAGAGADAPLALPSGREVFLHEVLTEDLIGQLWARFRFIAPGIGGADPADDDSGFDDMGFLCDRFAVPYLAEHAITPDRVVISLSDRVLPFGATDHDAKQFFGAFRLQDDRCIWEEF